jgi:hypothetical protein
MDVIIGQIMTKLKTLKNSCKEKYFKNGKAKFYLKNNNIYNTAKFSHKVGEIVNGKEINIFKNKNKTKNKIKTNSNSNSKRVNTQINKNMNKNKNMSNIFGTQNSKTYTPNVSNTLTSPNTVNSTAFNHSNGSNNFPNPQITEPKPNNQPSSFVPSNSTITPTPTPTPTPTSNNSLFDKGSVEPNSFEPEPTPEEAGSEDSDADT